MVEDEAGRLLIGTKTFALADVKAAAVAHHRAFGGGATPRAWAEYAASLAGQKADRRESKKRRDARLAVVGDAVAARGTFTRAQFDREMKRSFVDAAYEYVYAAPGAPGEAVLLAKAADAVRAGREGGGRGRGGALLCRRAPRALRCGSGAFLFPPLSTHPCPFSCQQQHHMHIHAHRPSLRSSCSASAGRAR